MTMTRLRMGVSSCDVEDHYKAQLRDGAASIVESWRSIVTKSGS
jgi:hypothetical protein